MRLHRVGFMDAIEALMTRKSVRRFRPDPVSEEIIEKILRAAMQAPSARNQQPWHFIVVDDKSVLKKLSGISQYARMIADAPVAVIVCGDLSLEVSKGMWMLDCANAAMSILLAAHALGLGGVWTAVYPREDRVENVRKVMMLPENVVPLCIIPLGYPDQDMAKEERFKRERVHKNKW